MSCNLDLLSEYLDGELSAPDRARMEDHLAACSVCRSALQVWNGVGEALEPPALAADFSGRVAQAVLAAPAPASLLSRLRSPVSRLLGDNPVAAMLRSRNSRRGAAAVPWRSVLLLFALPALLFTFPTWMDAEMAWVTHDYLSAFALFTGLGLLIGLPAWFLRTDVALLSSLHRGRCLEEILTANVSPALIVDTLATHSVKAILRAALPVAVVLLACCLPLDPQWRSSAVGLVLLWIPALVLTFFTLAYAMQAAATAGYMTQIGTWSRVGYLLLLPAWIPFALSFGKGMEILRVPGWLFLVWAMRLGAIEGLRRSLLVRSTGKKPLRWRLVGAWTDNAIVVRETRRRSLFDWTLAAVIFVPFGYLLVLFGLREEGWTHQFMVDTGWAAWWVLAVTSFFAAAIRTLGAVVGEKEKRTWEPLLEAGFPRSEFVSGWLQLGSLPVAVAQLPVYVLLTLWESSLGGVTGLSSLVFAGWLIGLVLTWSGAALGLALSALASTTREAGTRLVACGAGLTVLWLVCNGVLFLVALVGAEFGWWNAGSSMWAETVKYCLPAAALLVTSGLTLLLSRRVVKSELQLGGRGASLSSLPELGRWACWLGAPAAATGFALCADAGQSGMGVAALAVALTLLLVSGPVMALTRCAGGAIQGAGLGFVAGTVVAACSLALQKLLTPYAVLTVFLVTGKAYALSIQRAYEMFMLAPAVGAIVGLRMLSRQGKPWSDARPVFARRALGALLVGGGLLAVVTLWEDRQRRAAVSDPVLVERLVEQYGSRPDPNYRALAGSFYGLQSIPDLEARLPELRRLLGASAVEPATYHFQTLSDELKALAWRQADRYARGQSAGQEAEALTWRTYALLCSRASGIWSPAPLSHEVSAFVSRADLHEEAWSEWLHELQALDMSSESFGRRLDRRFANQYANLKRLQSLGEPTWLLNECFPLQPLDPLPDWYESTVAVRFANQYLAARSQLQRLEPVARPGELLGCLGPSMGRPYPHGPTVNRLPEIWRARQLEFEKLRVAIEMRLYQKQHGRLPRDASELPLTRSPWMPEDVTIVLNAQGVTALTDQGPVTLYSFEIPPRDE